MKKKLEHAFRKIFAYGIGSLMIAALFVAVCYVIAFFVGRPGSERLCDCLGKYVLPVLYVSAIFFCVIGVISMYLRGEHVFLLERSPNKKK